MTHTKHINMTSIMKRYVTWLPSNLLTCAVEHCWRTHVQTSATCPGEQLIYVANHSIWMAAVAW